MKAFNGSSATKAALLDQIDAGQPLPILESAINWQEQNLTGWAEDNGLPPVLAMLAASESQGGDAGRAFMREFLAAIEPGFDARPIAHRFVQWAWSQAPDPLQSGLRDPELRQAAEAIVEMHGRAANGDTVERREWRALRSRLTLLADAADEAVAALARVITACAWDFETVPGACVDMYAAWTWTAYNRKGREIGWTEKKQQARNLLVEQLMDRVTARLPVAPDRADEQAFQAYAATRGAYINEEVAAITDPIWADGDAATPQMIEAGNTLRDQCRAGLIGLVREATTVAA